MKDLILITAHCPTEEKRKILLDLVIGLQPIRKDFDLMVVSHTPVTFDVQERVDWAIYDRDNELLPQWEYQNQPWFQPIGNKRIQSVLVGGSGNTYLPVHKQLITGYSMAKTFGYEKIHCIEYDGLYKDFTEFYDNSRILDQYDGVLYMKEDGFGEINIEWGLGCFHAAKISSLEGRAFRYIREEMLEEIKNSSIRTTEKRTQDIYTANGNKVFFKDHSLLTQRGNSIRLVNFHQGQMEMQWAVPYYDSKSGKIEFVVWNESSDTPANVILIVNNREIHTYENIEKFTWRISEIGKIEDINTMIVMVNGKVKNHIVLDDRNRELFKITSFSTYFE